MPYKLIIAFFFMAFLLLTLPVAGEAASKRTSATPAKQLFGAKKTPAPLAPNPFGSYARGCLAGAQPLPVDGADWQAMRLSRNRNWGHPNLLAYIERLARDASELDDWSGLLVGDMSQPRGGPMRTGHKSHQIGLDADIWLRPSPAPDRALTWKEREQVSAISMKKNRYQINHKVWTEQHARLLRRAASYPEVARIFVHPTIKQELCGWAGVDRAWLRKIRAWYGHHYHFHVRLKCPTDSLGCKNQPDPPSGDGCGEELDWWLSDEPYKPKKPAKKPRGPLTLNDLPQACRTVLDAR